MNRLTRRIYVDEQLDDDNIPRIMLHALTGWTGPNTMRITTTIGGSQVIALIDNRSTHNFMSDKRARTLKLIAKPTRPFVLLVINGESMFYKGKLEKLLLSLQGTNFTLDFFSIPLYGVDFALGINGLKR